MRFGDICGAKKLDAKGENADLKMHLINEIHNQVNVSSTLKLGRSSDSLRDFLGKSIYLHPPQRVPFVNFVVPGITVSSLSVGCWLNCVTSYPGSTWASFTQVNLRAKISSRVFHWNSRSSDTFLDRINVVHSVELLLNCLWGLEIIKDGQ